MGFVFMGTGEAKMGMTRRDGDGNVIKHTPASWTTDPEGGSILTSAINPDTMKLEGDPQLYGDWDAAGYLFAALRILRPTRPINLPDFRAIYRKAVADHINICDYCESLRCPDCIVRQWEDEIIAEKEDA